MSKLPPISAPLHRRWREFRIQYLPLITFSLSALTAVILWSEFAVPQRCEPSNSELIETSLQPSLQTPALATVARISPTNSLSSEYSD
jgi:hypothetical protein